MSKENIQWLVLALVVVGFIGLGALTIDQGSQLTKVSNALIALNSKIENLGQPSATAKPSITPPATTVHDKTWNEYLNTYKQKLLMGIQGMRSYVKAFDYVLEESCDPKNPPSEMIPCDPKTKTMLRGQLTVYAEPSWKDGGTHSFYIEFGLEGPPAYFGPFTDNVLRLSQEASRATYSSKLGTLIACDAKKESISATQPNKAILTALGLGSLLAEGFTMNRICYDLPNNRAAFILAKQSLTSPGAGIEPTCVDNCDKDVIGTIDSVSGALNYKRLTKQLGIFSEAYNAYCLIDKTIPRSPQLNDKVLFYCGSGESGGLTSWYQYEIGSDKLTIVQTMTSLDPEKFDVKSPTLLKLFQYKSNADMR